MNNIGREIIQKTEIGDLISRNGFNKNQLQILPLVILNISL